MTTLKDLGVKTGNENLLDKVISIGNKCDLISKDSNLEYGLDILVSAKTGTGKLYICHMYIYFLIHIFIFLL